MDDEFEEGGGIKGSFYRVKPWNSFQNLKWTISIINMRASDKKINITEWFDQSKAYPSFGRNFGNYVTIIVDKT